MLALLSVLHGKLFLSLRVPAGSYRSGAANTCRLDDKRAFVHYFIGVKSAVSKCPSIGVTLFSRRCCPFDLTTAILWERTRGTAFADRPQ